MNRLASLLILGALLPPPPPSRAPAVATFAGGCYWCMEPPFERLHGVVSVTAGYVAHREAVEIVYDPRRITYAQLLDVFWHNVDPTDDGGQFCDRGAAYRTAIFVRDAEQKRLAEATKAALRRSMRVYTDILPAGRFERAADDEQHYFKRHPVRYTFYRLNCGRDDRLEQLWRAAPK